MLDVPTGPNGQPVAIVRPTGTPQQVGYAVAGGASVATTNPFAATTEAIMVALTSADADLRFDIGATPVASATTHLMVKPGVYFFRVKPGEKIAFLANSALAGTVTVSELKSLG